MLIHITSCDPSRQPDLAGWRALSSTATIPVEFTQDPAAADFIIVTGFDNSSHFRTLRGNPVWKKYPEKSFGIYEGDVAPRYLHGLYSGVPRRWNRTGRFSGLAYHWHQQCFPNPVPPHETIRATAKEFLFAYIGRSSHRIRKRILKEWQNKAGCWVEDSSTTYNHFHNDGSKRQDRQAHYWEMMAKAKFALCPAGAAPSSLRIFEAMEAGIPPVVISDQWVPPHGPDWDDFCLRIPESQIHNIKTLLLGIEPEQERRGRLAREAWERWFAPERYWDFLVASMREIRNNQKVPERLYTVAIPVMLAGDVVHDRLFRLMLKGRALMRASRTQLQGKR